MHREERKQQFEIRKLKSLDRRLNKSANLLDLPFILVLLLIVSVFTLLTFFVFDKVHTAFGKSPAFNATGSDRTSNATTNILTKSEAGFLSFDKLFFWGFISMFLFTLVSAYFIQSHPIFFIFGVIMMILIISLAAVMSNAYNAVETSTPELSAAARLFPLMDFIMNRLPWLIMVFGFLVLIVLVIKPLSGRGGL